MGLLEFIIFVAIIFNFSLGLFVFVKDPSKKLNRFFGIFCFLASLWIFTNLMMGIQGTTFWLKSASAVGVLLPLTALLWILEFCERKITNYQLIIISGLGLFFFIISYINDLIVANIKNVYFGGFEGEPGLFFVPFWLYILGILIFIVYSLISGYRETTGIKKLQISYVIIGACLYIFTVLIVSFVLPLFGIKKFIPLDTPSSLFLVFFTFLAIRRYHLFGIKVILTELLVVIIGILLLIQVFVVPVPLWKVINGIIFVLFGIFGYFLIRATFLEIKRKEEAEKIVLQEKELRIRAEKLVEEAERLSRAKDQFLLSIQHHLRTPFNPIRGYISMILEGTYGEEKNPKIKEKLMAIKKSSDILHKLMEELLDVQQIRMGKSILNLESVSLENLIEDVIQELKPEIDQRKLSLDFKKSILPEIKIDKKRIREAIWNLLDNAIKYTLEGKIEIKTEKKKENEKESILLAISDTGIGMEKEEIKYFLAGKLFERGQEAKKIYGPGRGIGLAVSREFIKAHGGKIWVESEGRGKGTTFYIELPIK